MSTTTATRTKTQALDTPEGRESAGKAFAWNGLQTWGTNFIALGVFVVLARLLTPADFGLAASAYVVIYFFRVLVDAGFSRLLIQRREITQPLADTAFWSALSFGTALALLCCLLAPLFSLLFAQPRLTGLIRVYSLIFVFVALDSTQSALLQRGMRWRVQAIRRLGAAVVSAGVAIGLAVAGAGVWALVGQQLTLEGLTALLIWPMVSWRPRWHFSTGAFKELFHFGARYSGLRILWYLGGSVDNFLVGVVLGPVALGFYVVGFRVFGVLTDLLTTTINNVALPVFSRVQDDHVVLNAQFALASAGAAAIAFPTFAGMGLVAHDAIQVFFGSRWLPSVPVVEALALAGALQAQFALTSSFSIALGRVSNELVWTALVLAAEVAGFAVAVNISITAVALATGIVFLIMWPVRLWLVHRWTDLSLGRYFAWLPPILAATAVLVAVTLALRHFLGSLTPAESLLAQVVVGAAVYPTALFAFAPQLARALVARVQAVRAAA